MNQRMTKFKMACCSHVGSVVLWLIMTLNQLMTKFLMLCNGSVVLVKLDTSQAIKVAQVTTHSKQCCVEYSPSELSYRYQTVHMSGTLDRGYEPGFSTKIITQVESLCVLIVNTPVINTDQKSGLAMECYSRPVQAEQYSPDTSELVVNNTTEWMTRDPVSQVRVTLTYMYIHTCKCVLSLQQCSESHWISNELLLTHHHSTHQCTQPMDQPNNTQQHMLVRAQDSRRMSSETHHHQCTQPMDQPNNTQQHMLVWAQDSRIITL